MTPKSGRPARSEKDIQAMRAKIADVAQKLFREEGFDAVSIRRLAKEVGCAPMTIYAHFDTKSDILRDMWSDVLEVLFQEIEQNLVAKTDPIERLQIATETFVIYWLKYPDQFRLIFMSNDVDRGFVDAFLQDSQVQEKFAVFEELVRKTDQYETEIKAKTDILVSAMIGIALSHITIKNYDWTTPLEMTRILSAMIKS